MKQESAQGFYLFFKKKFISLWIEIIKHAAKRKMNF